jgi:hypothetical protein
MRKLQQVSLNLPNNLNRFTIATRPWLEYGLRESAATRALMKLERLRDVE